MAAERFVLLDANSGVTLDARRATHRAPIASIQKLLAALVIVDGGQADGEVEIHPSDLDISAGFVPAMANLRVGESYLRRTLLEAMLVGSANDATMALARTHSGSTDKFAKAMTDYSRSLGMIESHFVNPHGLPAEGQYSTARDVASLALAADGSPLLRELVRTPATEVAHADGTATHLANTNRLLGSAPGCDGMKTGFTRAAGACLVASADTPTGRRIAIVLGATRETVWDDTQTLLGSGEAFSTTT